MNAGQLRKTVYNKKLSAQLNTLINNFESRHAGERGVSTKRELLAKRIEKFNPEWPGLAQSQLTHEQRVRQWRKRSALRLAEMAGQKFDEHGYDRGDYLTTYALDFIAPHEGSANAPYLDAGGEGLGLISICRTRIYAKSYGHAPGEASTRYLVGKNEAGTYFAHPVSKKCTTVAEAVDWIWSGYSAKLVLRQGDIALISTNGGPKIPTLPRGHEVKGRRIMHATHPPIRLPRKGERVIVARRAYIFVSDATRD